MIEESEALLFARAEDLLRRAERGEIVYGKFLTPREEILIRRRLAGEGERYLFWGGYAAAERKRVYCLPPYFADMDEPCRAELLSDAFAESTISLSIEGSGYRELSHRDFLGALLHSGLSRDALGDVALLSPFRAVTFCGAEIAAFLEENLSRVANDAVRVSRIALPPDFDGGKRYKNISDTVPSPRADAVVAALAHLSRERAKELFAAGKIEIDYETEERGDYRVVPGTVIVISGVGKFTVRDVSDQTRKGRYRLLADQHI